MEKNEKGREVVAEVGCFINPTMASRGRGGGTYVRSA